MHNALLVKQVCLWPSWSSSRIETMTLYHTVILYARILKCFLAIKSKIISKMICLFFMTTSCNDHDESKVLNFTREWAQTTYLPKWLASLFCWQWTFTPEALFDGYLCQLELTFRGLKKIWFPMTWVLYSLLSLHFSQKEIGHLSRKEYRFALENTS